MLRGAETDDQPLLDLVRDHVATHPSWRFARWVPGVALGLIVVGPGLGVGAPLSLDLVVTPQIPMPAGLWGLGPGLTQRVPFFALLAAASGVVGGPVATQALIVIAVAVAFVGAGRLVGPRAGVLPQAVAGLAWAAGPFALTRIGVGHLGLLWSLAVLPWVLPRLCRPSSMPEATFLGALAMAIGGPSGGTLGLAIVGVGLVVEPRVDRRIGAVSVACIGANLVWILPTMSVLWAGAQVASAGDFSTRPVGAAGWPSILAGGGFWQPGFQVGTGGWPGAVAGIVLLALALVGHGDLDQRWARGARVVAFVGLGAAVASAVPGVRLLYDAASALPIGAPLRESQRFLALWLVWAVPAAALGAARMRRGVDGSDQGTEVAAMRRGLGPVVALAPVALALVVSVPGWWGIEGRLAPRSYPEGWHEARALILADPGPTVALPWSMYPPLSFAAGRQVFNPLPDFIGGDVISSYDPVFDRAVSSQEQVDRRARVIDPLSDRAIEGVPISGDLADLGVRWIVLAHETGHEQYLGLASDPGLRLALEREDMTLYEVRGWRGPVEGPGGWLGALHRPIPPVLDIGDAPPGAVIDVAGAPGWVRGMGAAATVTADGRLEVPEGTGPLWFWPALVIVVADLAVLALAIRARWRYRQIVRNGR